MKSELPPKDQRQPWHTHKLHFGKFNGWMLGELPLEGGRRPYLEDYLQKKWEPKPEYKSKADDLLLEMIEQSKGKTLEAVEDDIPF